MCGRRWGSMLSMSHHPPSARPHPRRWAEPSAEENGQRKHMEGEHPDRSRERTPSFRALDGRKLANSNSSSIRSRLSWVWGAWKSLLPTFFATMTAGGADAAAAPACQPPESKSHGSIWELCRVLLNILDYGLLICIQRKSEAHVSLWVCHNGTIHQSIFEQCLDVCAHRRKWPGTTLATWLLSNQKEGERDIRIKE